MTTTLNHWFTERYAKAVAAGLHDDQCEQLPDQGFHLCHCSKRERIARGITELPDELIHQYPLCPTCLEETNHDGDSFCCENCHVVWVGRGEKAEWTDDYGDIETDRQKWLARGQA